MRGRRIHHSRGLRLCLMADALRAVSPGTVAVDTMAREFRVTGRQIRRDLDALASIYRVKRSHREGPMVTWIE